MTEARRRKWPVAAASAGIAAVGAIVWIVAAQPWRDDPTLSQVVTHGTEQELRDRLAEGADPGENDQGDGPPLFAALDSENHTAMRILIDAGADPNVLDEFGMSLLARAVENDDAIAVKLLLDANADPNLVGRNAWTTPLLLATSSVDPTLARALLDAGADPDRSIEGAGSPLTVAAAVGDADAVEMLLGAGADPKRRDADGGLPSDATDCGLSVLLAHGASVDWGVHRLEALAQCGDGGELLLLSLAAGTDPANADGAAALLWSAIQPEPRAAQALIDAGADPNAMVALGFDDAFTLAVSLSGRPLSVDQLDTLLRWTPVVGTVRADVIDVLGDSVSTWDDLGTIAALVEYAEDLDDLGSYSPLFAAALAGESDTVRLLLDAGADPATRNGDDAATAADVAQLFGHADVVALLSV